MNTPGNKVSRAKRRKPKVNRRKLDYNSLKNDNIRENLTLKFSNAWENIQLTDLDNSNINDLIIKTIETAATEITS